MNNIDRKKIKEAFEESGDLTGLQEIEKQLNNINNDDSEIQDLLTCIYKLNYILIETEQQNYASKYNTKILDVYVDMKTDLFDRLKIDID